MISANIYQAKTQFSKLISEVEKGKEIVIAKGGKPVAKLIKYEDVKKKRLPGLLKGKIIVPRDFDEESKELNEIFYGSKI